MIGKLTDVPPTSAMSPDQLLWSSTGSTDTAMALALRFSNSPLRSAVRPSSVVHTGVKSAGWLKSTAHLPDFQSWKPMLPSVVSAVKSGASSPSRIPMLLRPSVLPYVLWKHRAYSPSADGRASQPVPGEEHRSRLAPAMVEARRVVRI